MRLNNINLSVGKISLYIWNVQLHSCLRIFVQQRRATNSPVLGVLNLFVILLLSSFRNVETDANLLDRYLYKKCVSLIESKSRIT